MLVQLLSALMERGDLNDERNRDTTEFGTIIISGSRQCIKLGTRVSI